MLKTRIRTGVGIAAMIVLVLAFSHVQWFLKLITIGLSVASIVELYHATGTSNNKALSLISYIGAALLCLWNIPHYELLVGVLFTGAVVLFIWLMANIHSHHSLGTLFSVLTAVMITVFYNCLGFIRSLNEGLYLLTLAVLLCSLCDVSAYFVGRKLGHKKMAPAISPNKTIAGSLGGVLATFVVFMLVTFGLDVTGVLSVHYGKLAFYLISASFVAQFGDLSFSAIKRIVGIKDYGQSLPGHGGFLDRFDSTLFVLPYTCLFVYAVGPFFL